MVITTSMASSGLDSVKNNNNNHKHTHHLFSFQKVNDDDQQRHSNNQHASNLSRTTSSSNMDDQYKYVPLSVLSRTTSSNNVDDQYEYAPLSVINRGSFGIVYKAREKKTGQIVALKQECHGLSRSTLREIDILKSLPRHPSIVEFKQVLQDNCGRVFVVMEYLENDLRRFMRANENPFTLSAVKFLMKQILEGVNFLHEKGLMHRDLKPSNILINNNAQLKICDFGLSRCIRSKSGLYTPRVGTLWYKAPEVLLGADTYSSAVDMWSVGCIMAELILRVAVFKGRSESHQLHCILDNIMGSKLRNRFYVATSFEGAPLLTSCGFDLIERLLCCDPRKRITAKEALNHNWFKEYYVWNGLSSLFLFVSNVHIHFCHWISQYI